MKPAPATQDERILIEAAQRDPSRFAELYERNFARVYGYAARRVSTREEAEDVTSEVFERALANLAKFEWRGVPFLAWLLRIAQHAMADRWQGGEQAGEAAEPAVWEETEQRAILFELVETLPAVQRHVIVERFVEQRSIREIAESLKRTEGAVKQLQLRALKTLRARMGRADG